MPWPPHRTLYELGRGGMGVVELAELGPRLVAVKRILPYRAGDAKTRSAFLREARLLARIDHPNVVRALAVDEGRGDEQPPALMMQYVAGVPLKELLAASPEGLPVAVAARLGLDVARGLHAAHELCDETGRPFGVVHRDVSPHNVLVTFEGHAVLLDFGVAKTNDATRTLTGEVKGKLAYMAPEQAMADPVDRRSDLYALGALLYEMLSGRRMHGEGTDLEILKRMVSERPPPLGSLRPEVPASLAALVARMTEESPDRRPATADEVASALEPFAGGAGPPEVAAHLDGLLPGARRRHDEQLAEARAAATRSATPLAAGDDAVVAEPAPAPHVASAPGSRPSGSTSSPPRPFGASGRAAPTPEGLGRSRPFALALGVVGLGLGALGVGRLLSERGPDPFVAAPSPPAEASARPLADAASRPPSSALAAPSSSALATTALSAPGPHAESGAPTPAAAPSQRRSRPPPVVRKPPPAAPATASGAPARPPTPLPVDTSAIGGDDR